MVDKVNITKEKLKKIYHRVKDKTRNFLQINPEIIAENCQSIIIFRLALGLSVKEFAKICKRSAGSIDNLQRSSKKINFGVAEYYTNKIKKLWSLSDTKWGTIEKRYDSFYGRALKGIKILSKEEIKKFAKIGSEKSLKERKNSDVSYFKASRKGIEKQILTEQEKKIQKLLEKNDIQYKIHKFLHNENIDFLIKGNILVGCASGKEKNMTHHARRLMYQAYRIKYYNKNLKYIAILGNSHGDLKKEEVPFGAKKLLDEICNAWYVDENINQFIIFIAGLDLQAHQANDQ